MHRASLTPGSPISMTLLLATFSGIILFVFPVESTPQILNALHHVVTLFLRFCSHHGIAFVSTTKPTETSATPGPPTLPEHAALLQ